MRLVPFACLSLLGTLSGCGDPAAPKAAPTARPVATATPGAAAADALDGCLVAGPGVRVRRAHAVIGRGRVGVVTVSGPGGDACQWQEIGTALAARGLAVQVSASGVGDEPDEVVANVERLRDEGVRAVALLSASAGGTTAIRAARRAGVSALVTLSAVRFADGTDGVRRARRLTVPALHVGSRGDPDTAEGADTRAFGRTGSALLVDGSAHGTDLVADHPELVRQIAAALRDGR